MSVQNENGRGWDVSFCVVERRVVMSHWEGFAMFDLTGHYLFTWKKLSLLRALDTWRSSGYHAIALGRTT